MVSFALPLIALVVLPLLELPESVNEVAFGLSLAGGPDVLMIAAAAIMGRENMDRILGKIGPWARRLLRWDSVTQARYTAGLWILSISFLLPYPIALFFDDSIANADGKPGWGSYVMTASSIAFLLAFVSMGAPLWERVRAIFTWDARITFPEPGSTDAAVAHPTEPG